MHPDKHHQERQHDDKRSLRLEPPSFVCPLTRRIMEDPVMDTCAHSFERSAILEWLSGADSSDNSHSQHHPHHHHHHHKHNRCRNYCPISRKPLLESDLIPNHTLAERIEKWNWLRETDGILWDNAENGHSSAATIDSSSDEEEDEEGGQRMLPVAGQLTHPDIENGLPLKKKKKRRYNNRINNYTTSIPAEFMLLPQERHVLRIVRLRAAENVAQQRRKRCVCWTVVIFGTIVTVAIVLGAVLWMKAAPTTTAAPTPED